MFIIYIFLHLSIIYLIFLSSIYLLISLFYHYLGNLLLQKLHLCVVSHKTKRTIDRVFPDYNIALRELTIQAAANKAKLLKEKEKEKIYRSSFLGISSRVLHSVIPDFAISLFYKSNNNDSNKLNDERKNGVKTVDNRADLSAKSFPSSHETTK